MKSNGGYAPEREAVSADGDADLARYGFFRIQTDDG